MAKQSRTKQDKQRIMELKRQSYVSAVEAEAIGLCVGESSKHKLLDLECLQRLRTRLNRHKNSTGADIKTFLDGSELTVTRFEDVEVR